MITLDAIEAAITATETLLQEYAGDGHDLISVLESHLVILTYIRDLYKLIKGVS